MNHYVHVQMPEKAPIVHTVQIQTPAKSYNCDGMGSHPDPSWSSQHTRWCCYKHPGGYERIPKIIGRGRLLGVGCRLLGGWSEGDPRSLERVPPELRDTTTVTMVMEVPPWESQQRGTVMFRLQPRYKMYCPVAVVDKDSLS